MRHKLLKQLILIMILFGALSGTVSAADDIDYSRKISEAYRQFKQLDTYRMFTQIELVIVKDGQSFGVTNTSLFDVKQSPFELNGIMRMTIKGEQRLKSDMVSFYAVNDNGKLKIYGKDQFAWSKLKLPYDLGRGLDTLSSFGELSDDNIRAIRLSAIEAVEVVAVAQEQTTLRVRVNPHTFMTQMVKASLMEQHLPAQVMELYKQAGTFDMYVVLDNSTGMVIQIKADVSDYFKRLLTLFKMNDGLLSRRAAADDDIIELFAKAKLTITVDFSQFNQAIVSMPAELTNFQGGF